MLKLLSVLVAQLWLILCDPMDCSPPGSSICGILQARILEWVAIPFSRGSSQPRDRTLVSCTVGGLFTVWVTKEGQWAVRSVWVGKKPKTIGPKHFSPQSSHFVDKTFWEEWAKGILPKVISTHLRKIIWMWDLKICIHWHVYQD